MRQEMSLVRAGTVAQVALRTVDSLTLIMAAGMGWQDNRAGTLDLVLGLQKFTGLGAPSLRYTGVTHKPDANSHFPNIFSN